METLKEPDTQGRRENSEQITGVILSGGVGTRMNGIKKGFLCYEGNAFIERARLALADCGEVCLSAPLGAAAEYADTGLRVIEDLRAGIGPLAGIEAALTYLGGAVFLPCDMPFILKTHVALLLDDFKKHGKPVFFAEATAPHMAGQEQTACPNPLAGIYTADCLPLIQEAIAEKRYKVRLLLSQIQHRLVHMEASVMRNINSPEDYNAYCKTRAELPKFTEHRKEREEIV
ncbi:MAG: molybdenum cofactor guanylyltransferase [Clostridiales bacterium]|jgi:molybdopterin-guanine dinucleotide biosynthesis protein A|nr:molybdenum cofactor guanylyltransferase [Clostridiales bacterium]